MRKIQKKLYQNIVHLKHKKLGNIMEYQSKYLSPTKEGAEEDYQKNLKPILEKNWENLYEIIDHYSELLFVIGYENE